MKTSQAYRRRLQIAVTLTFTIVGLGVVHGAEPEPPWAEPRCGIQALEPDYLPPGWTELNLAGQTVTTSWKRMRIANNGLPSSISVRETELLAEPITLDLKVDGATPLLSPGTCNLSKIGKGLITGESILSSAELDVHVTTRIEYDFMIQIQIELRPKKPVSLDLLTLNCAIPAEIAESCHYVDEEPSEFKGGGIYAERRRQFVVLGPTGTVSRGFCPIFWLGNTHAGISWNAESARNWRPPATAAIVYSRETEHLQFNLVTTPMQLGEAVSYTLLLQPTPFRDMPKNWRTWNFGCRQILTNQVPQQDLVREYVMYWSSLDRLGGEAYNSWVRDPEALQEAVTRDHASGFKVLPYVVPSLVSYEEIFTKDGKNYHFLDRARQSSVGDWGVKVHGGATARSGYHAPLAIPEDAITITSLEERNRLWQGKMALGAKYGNALVGPSPGYSDFFAWHVAKYARDFDADGLYVDGISPGPDFTIVEGDPNRGYGDTNGTVRPFYSYLAMRNQTKRMRYMFDEKEDRTGFMLGHTSGARVAPIASHYDTLIVGETLFYWYQEPEKREASPSGDYYYAHIFGDIDGLKGRFFWRQWGVPYLFLPEVRGKDRQVFPNPTKGTRTMLAYILHFDMLLWPNWGDMQEMLRWWKIKDAYGMSEDDGDIIDFVPYWENNLVTTDDEAAKISYYMKTPLPDPYIDKEDTNNLLVIVSNLRFDTADVVLNLPEKLRACKITDVDGGRELDRSQAGMLKLTLAPYDYAILHVKD